MKKNILLLGSPGAGKGTAGTRFITENKQYTLITTGDILREEKNSGSELGNILKEIIGSGKLVPDDIINKIVENKIRNTEGPFVFDGYPRTVPQAKFLEKILPIDFVVYLKVGDEMVIERILERGKTSGRDDDQDINIIHKRLTEFKTETQPLVDFYSKKKCLFTVNAEDTIEEVYAEFNNLILGLLFISNEIEKGW
jgi:adenylate kinase